MVERIQLVTKLKGGVYRFTFELPSIYSNLL
jgi:hypothetical protein